MIRDPASEQALNGAADSVESAATAVELAALGVVAVAIGSITVDSTYTSMRARESRDIKAMEAALKRGRKLLTAQSDQLIYAMADATDEWAAKYYTAASKAQVKAAQNVNMKPAISSGTKANSEAIERLCRTSMIEIVSPDGELLPMEKAYRAHVDNAIRAIKAGENVYQDAIAKAVNDLASYGMRVRYESGATRELYAAVRTNVMDGYRTTMDGIRSAQGREFGADGVEVTAHGMCAPDHQPYQGRQYSKRDFDRLNASLERPLVTGANCVIEGTIVDASNANAAFRRHYEGDVITIRTSFGNNISVTPNHPILTDRGWIAACEINKGDNVFSSRVSNGETNGVSPYIEQNISRIENFFSSSSHKLKIFHFPSTPADFHGDGSANENIDIVFINSNLRRNRKTSISKQIKQFLFHDAISFSDFALRNCSFSQIGIRLFCTSNRIVSFTRNFLSFFLRHSRHSNALRFASGFRSRITVLRKNFGNYHFMNSKSFSNRTLVHSAFVKLNNFINIIFYGRNRCINSGINKSRPNDLYRDTNILANLTKGHSGIAQIDKVVDVNINSFSGHVYNLSTTCGWYFANNIITHNCHHSTFPVLLGVSSDKYTDKELQAIADRSNQEITFAGVGGKPTTMTRYDATQYQRKVEGAIRQNNMAASLADSASASTDAKRKARELTAYYKVMSKDAGLTTRIERTQAYTLK